MPGTSQIMKTNTARHVASTCPGSSDEARQRNSGTDPTRARDDHHANQGGEGGVDAALAPLCRGAIEVAAPELAVWFKPDIKRSPVGDSSTRGQFEPINVALREHQCKVTDWEFGKAAKGLHLWAERMVSEFALDVGVPSLLIERLRRLRLGHFRYKRNGFGLWEEIAIDTEHLRRDKAHEILGTLLHELLHAWQQGHGRPSKGNYHNGEFCAKALSFGLVVDRRGHTRYLGGDTPFFSLLRKHGIQVPEDPDAEEQEEPEASVTFDVPAPAVKLRLYECPCGVKARVGRSRFNAQCLDCGGRFVLKEKSNLESNERRP